MPNPFLNKRQEKRPSKKDILAPPLPFGEWYDWEVQGERWYDPGYPYLVTAEQFAGGGSQKKRKRSDQNATGGRKRESSLISKHISSTKDLNKRVNSKYAQNNIGNNSFKKGDLKKGNKSEAVISQDKSPRDVMPNSSNDFIDIYKRDISLEKTPFIDHDQHFEDQQTVHLPYSIVPFEWKKVADIFPDVQLEVYVDSKTCPDLISGSKHLLHSEFMRSFISSIHTLVYLGNTAKFDIEYVSPTFIPTTEYLPWRPWHHIYSNPDAGTRFEHRPNINKIGKYIVRLFWMGAWRKVYVDDLLPVDIFNRVLLPSLEVPNEINIKRTTANPSVIGIHSSERFDAGAPVVQIWPFLLTKALLKIASFSWYGEKEIIDFDIIQCLTGWVPLKVNTKDTPITDIWSMCWAYTHHYNWASDHGSTIDVVTYRKSGLTLEINKEDDGNEPEKDRMEKVIKEKVVEDQNENEYVRKIIDWSALAHHVVAHCDDLRDIPEDGNIPEFSPCWPHEFLIDQTRNVPLTKPYLSEADMVGWKRLRWIAWAADKGLVNREELRKDICCYKLVTPFRNIYEHVVYNQPSKIIIDMENIHVQGEDTTNKEKKKKTSRSTKHTKKRKSKHSESNYDIIEEHDPSFWVDHEKLAKHINSITIYYKPSRFKQKTEISDIEMKKHTEKWDDEELPQWKFVLNPVVMRSCRNEPVYIFTESLESKVVVINLTQTGYTQMLTPTEKKKIQKKNSIRNDITECDFCLAALVKRLKTNIQSSELKECISVEKPEQRLVEYERSRCHIVVEEYTWTTDKLGDTVASINTYGSKTTALEFGPGRKILKLWIKSDTSYTVQIFSDAFVVAGGIEKLLFYMSKESQLLQYMCYDIANNFLRLVEAFGTHKFSSQLKSFYKSYKPNEPLTKIESSIVHDVFYELLYDLVKNGFETEEPYALRILLLRWQSIPRVEYPEMLNLCNCYEDEDVEYLKMLERYIVTIQAFTRGMYERTLMKYHSIYHNNYVTIIEGLLNIYTEIFSPKNIDICSNLIRAFLEHPYLDEIKEKYDIYHELQNVVTLKNFTDKIKVGQSQWSLICRRQFYINSAEPIPVKIYLLCHLENYVVRVIDNDTFTEVKRFTNNVAVNKYRTNSKGYTILCYAWSSTQKKISYELILATRKEVNSNKLSLSPVNTESHCYYGMYVPNKTNTVFKYVVRVGSEQALLSIYLTSSFPNAILNFKLYDEKKRILQNITGKGSLILPAIALIQRRQPPSTTTLASTMSLGAKKGRHISQHKIHHGHGHEHQYGTESHNTLKDNQHGMYGHDFHHAPHHHEPFHGPQTGMQGHEAHHEPYHESQSVMHDHGFHHGPHLHEPHHHLQSEIHDHKSQQVSQNEFYGHESHHGAHLHEPYHESQYSIDSHESFRRPRPRKTRHGPHPHEFHHGSQSRMESHHKPHLHEPHHGSQSKMHDHNPHHESQYSIDSHESLRRPHPHKLHQGSKSGMHDHKSRHGSQYSTDSHESLRRPHPHKPQQGSHPHEFNNESQSRMHSQESHHRPHLHEPHHGSQSRMHDHKPHHEPQYSIESHESLRRPHPHKLHQGSKSGMHDHKSRHGSQYSTDSHESLRKPHPHKPHQGSPPHEFHDGSQSETHGQEFRHKPHLHEPHHGSQSRMHDKSRHGSQYSTDSHESLHKPHLHKPHHKSQSRMHNHKSHHEPQYSIESHESLRRPHPHKPYQGSHPHEFHDGSQSGTYSQESQQRRNLYEPHHGSQSRMHDHKSQHGSQYSTDSHESLRSPHLHKPHHASQSEMHGQKSHHGSQNNIESQHGPHGHKSNHRLQSGMHGHKSHHGSQTSIDSQHGPHGHKSNHRLQSGMHGHKSHHGSQTSIESQHGPHGHKSNHRLQSGMHGHKSHHGSQTSIEPQHGPHGHKSNHNLQSGMHGRKSHHELQYSVYSHESHHGSQTRMHGHESHHESYPHDPHQESHSGMHGHESHHEHHESQYGPFGHGPAHGPHHDPHQYGTYGHEFHEHDSHHQTTASPHHHDMGSYASLKMHKSKEGLAKPGTKVSHQIVSPHTHLHESHNGHDPEIGEYMSGIFASHQALSSQIHRVDSHAFLKTPSSYYRQPGLDPHLSVQGPKPSHRYSALRASFKARIRFNDSKSKLSVARSQNLIHEPRILHNSRGPRDHESHSYRELRNFRGSQVYQHGYSHGHQEIFSKKPMKEPVNYLIVVTVLDDTWPLNAEEWKNVENPVPDGQLELFSRELAIHDRSSILKKNGLPAILLKKQRKTLRPNAHIPLENKMRQTKVRMSNASESPFTQKRIFSLVSATSKFSTTSATNIPKQTVIEALIQKPFWYMETVVNDGEVIEITKDKKQEDYLRRLKDKWTIRDPTRRKRAHEIRKKFLDENKIINPFCKVYDEHDVRTLDEKMFTTKILPELDLTPYMKKDPATVTEIDRKLKGAAALQKEARIEAALLQKAENDYFINSDKMDQYVMQQKYNLDLIEKWFKDVRDESRLIMKEVYHKRRIVATSLSYADQNDLEEFDTLQAAEKEKKPKKKQTAKRKSLKRKKELQ